MHDLLHEQEAGVHLVTSADDKAKLVVDMDGGLVVTPHVDVDVVDVSLPGFHHNLANQLLGNALPGAAGVGAGA